MPCDQAVLTRGDIFQRKGSVIRRECVPAVGNDNDGGVHVGVEVTIHLDDSWLVKFRDACTSSGVVAKVELLHARERKDVVKNRIFVGKGHGRADGDYHDLGFEPTVALYQLGLDGFFVTGIGQVVLQRHDSVPVFDQWAGTLWWER